ncbi:cupredoxin family copper-binding protein [Dyella sp. ASV21]|uniref:cupredoxin domain-containing protein n=1 Tax=Dyella sp. ASV21 TaxID=2795114 RepID=UPI0018ECF194|nr:cupredoxin family copper-binding protein [Dyella sp. ASV21]
MNAFRAVAVAMLLLGMQGGGVPAVAAPANAVDKPVRIDIRNFAFAPATLTVPAGTRVVWTNRDDEPHLITSAGKQFDASRALDTGDTYAVTFAKPGTYAYYCSIHPMMVGTIIVQ